MKKTLMIFALSFLFLFSCLPFNVFASPSLLADEEGVLTQYEAERIKDELERISAEYGMDFVIVTSQDFDRKDADDFADDYYDYGGYNNDGIILVLSVNLGEVFVSTSGNAINVFPDKSIDRILDEIVDDLSYAEYADAFEKYLSNCEKLCSDIKSSHAENQTHHSDNISFISFKQLGICVVLGLIIGLIGVSIMKSGMKTVRAKTNARDYMVAGSLVLTEKYDTFLYRNVSRVRRQNNSSSGGNRIGPSGRSHGGSGRSFR